MENTEKNNLKDEVLWFLEVLSAFQGLCSLKLVDHSSAAVVHLSFIREQEQLNCSETTWL